MLPLSLETTLGLIFRFGWIEWTVVETATALSMLIMMLKVEAMALSPFVRWPNTGVVVHHSAA